MRYWFFTIHKTPKRAEATQQFVLDTLHKHTAYFKDLSRQGKCMFAGPFVDQTTDLGGGFYSFQCDTEEEAKRLADKDPFVAEGLYSYRIQEWKKVVPEETTGTSSS